MVQTADNIAFGISPGKVSRDILNNQRVKTILSARLQVSDTYIRTLIHTIDLRKFDNVIYLFFLSSNCLRLISGAWFKNQDSKITYVYTNIHSFSRV